MAKKKEGESSFGKFEEKFSGFVFTYKKLLIIVAAVLVVAIVAVWVGISIGEKSANSHQVAIDKLQQRYIHLSDNQEGDNSASVEQLKGDLSEIAKKRGSSYPVVKAHYLLGLIAFEEGSFDEALSHFLEVTSRSKGSYLHSLSLLNAAVVSEYQGNDSLALEYYQSLYDQFGSDSAESAKALFNVARLHEQGENIELAKAVFQQLVDEFGGSEYAKLAQSRLIALD